MLLEEFYKYDASRDGDVVNKVYLTTLQNWLVYNDFHIYERLLELFEQKEDYLVCEGINRALDYIEDKINQHFENAEKLQETEEEVLYSVEEHKRISRLIFTDILREIYEKQVSERQKDSRE